MTSWPSMVIRPPVGSMRRLTIFIDVVLPQPDGPTRTQISPAGIVRRQVVDGRRLRAAGYRLRDVLEGDDGAGGVLHRPMIRTAAVTGSTSAQMRGPSS